MIGQKGYISIGENKELGTEKRVTELERESKRNEDITRMTLTIILGIVIVLFIAIVGFWYDYYRFHSESFVDLKKSVDNLRSDINDKNYDNLLVQINYLKDELREIASFSPR
jgi:hypothetical protein